MSVSNFLAEHREKQQENLKKFLLWSFLASTVLHGVVLPLGLNFVKPAESAEEPIEFVVVEEPETKAAKPELAVEKEVAPPPETPPTPKEEPLAETPPPTPKEEPLAETPPPIPKEEPLAETPPTTPLEPPSSADSPPAAPVDTVNERHETENSSAPPNEPPVTSSRPGGTGEPTDLVGGGGNPNSPDNPRGSKPNSPSGGSDDAGEPLSEPLGKNSGGMARSPVSDSPVTASRPGGGSTTGGSLENLGNPPSASQMPGGGDILSSTGGSGEGEVPASEPFGSGSGAMARSPRNTTDSPVTASRPGGGGGSGNLFGDAGNSDVSGIPGGEGGGGNGRNSPSAGSGDGSGDGSGLASSEPFSSGSGAIPKSGNSGGRSGGAGSSGGGSSSRRSGGVPGTCIRCGQPSYPTQARREKRQGRVQLSVDIDPSGNVLAVVVANSSGYEDLDKAAIDSVRSWKFSSAEGGIQGKLVTVKFELTN
ncbi:MAG: TonB family protein [Actinomycetota bacterium]